MVRGGPRIMGAPRLRRLAPPLADPVPPPMTTQTRLRVANFALVFALVLLALSIYGMVQPNRPSWSRGLAVPALVLIIVGNQTRRRARREAAGPTV